MNVLTEQELLAIWESGHSRPLIEKALLLLSVAYGAEKSDSIARWSIGQRDSQLFLLRAQLFGNVFVNHCRCPSCAELMEWEMKLQEFPIQTNIAEGVPLHTLTYQGYEITFRLPNSVDLIETNANKILLNCIDSIVKGKEAVEPAILATQILEHLGEEMEKLEPMANLSFLLDCPACSHQWSLQFDIISYLWTEINNWARHLLKDIVALARAFSWSESEILSLGKTRRQLYLQMIDA